MKCRFTHFSNCCHPECWHFISKSAPWVLNTWPESSWQFAVLVEPLECFFFSSGVCLSVGVSVTLTDLNVSFLLCVTLKMFRVKRQADRWRMHDWICDFRCGCESRGLHTDEMVTRHHVCMAVASLWLTALLNSAWVTGTDLLTGQTSAHRGESLWGTLH